MAEEQKPSTVTIDGKEYEIPELTLGPKELADAIARRMASLKYTAVEAFARGMDQLQGVNNPGLRDVLADAAIRAMKDEKRPKFDLQEAREWLNTGEGAAWMLWMQLKQKHPDIKLERVEAAVAEQMQAALAAAKSES